LIYVTIGIVIVALLLAARRYSRFRGGARERMEDALKLLVDARRSGDAIQIESLASRLGMSDGATAVLLQNMVEKGLVRTSRGPIALTPEGKALGFQVLRAHRLWERYLADDTDVALKKIHRIADRKEHRLTEEEIKSLEARLGYPDRDPHGDPIPAAVNGLEVEPGTPLTNWPLNTPAEVVHIEDEPESVFNQILSEGILPGTYLALRESTDKGMRLEIEGEEIWLPPVVTANIFVLAATEKPEAEEAGFPLSRLPLGQAARVLKISEEIRGLARRRLLDLGFTRGALVQPILRSSFGGGDPVAYRIRGTTIALRREQTEKIHMAAIDEVTSSDR
jgi:DtxR family Mn-dependent transcriptional regulator